MTAAMEAFRTAGSPPAATIIPKNRPAIVTAAPTPSKPPHPRPAGRPGKARGSRRAGRSGSDSGACRTRCSRGRSRRRWRRTWGTSRTYSDASRRRVLRRHGGVVARRNIEHERRYHDGRDALAEWSWSLAASSSWNARSDRSRSTQTSESRMSAKPTELQATYSVREESGRARRDRGASQWACRWTTCRCTSSRTTRG